ncbi:hypothetical protein ABK040_006276 [Willaertia magna]
MPCCQSNSSTPQPQLGGGNALNVNGSGRSNTANNNNGSSLNLPMMKVVVVGSQGVGKTSLVQRFVNDVFTNRSEPTIGADFLQRVVLVDGQQVKLNLWDTAGQEKFRSPIYYREATAILIVYDITSMESFQMLDKTWIRDLREKAPPEAILVLIGNKLDMQEKRQVSFDEGKEYCKSLGALTFVEVSAKIDNESKINSLFESVVKEYLKRKKSQQ